ncbi:MAG TPA: amino acid adenylation domain-containing protein [Chitinophagaceae bacterium]|nr:amino acid adenylation domain-containing protein [Chitinophagaceae bacterium]
MEELLLKLTEYNIDVRVEKGNLRLNIPDGLDAKDILREVKVNKEELIAYINERVKLRNNFRIIEQSIPANHYSLSSAQKRLYFLHQFDKESLAYNMPTVVRLEGALDTDRLSNAFNKLIARHESLRTSFEVVNEEAVQVIAEMPQFGISRHEAREKEVNSIIKAFVRPFDLGKAPLLRAGLIRIAENDHILMIDMHHIITDGVSQGILFKDFMALYDGQELPELKIHYRDYALWQQGQEEQERIAQQKKFWLNEFAEETTVLELPADHPRPAVKTEQGAEIAFDIDEATTVKLRSLAEQEGTTLFMVMLAVYNILLARLGNQEDIVVGTPIAGRQHADLENIIGLFVNTLPLRNYPKGHLSFREFLASVKQRTLACFDNQAYQYENLIDELKVDRNTNRNPLFDVMFAFQNYDRHKFSVPGLTMQPYGSGNSISQFDLTLMAFDRGDRLVFKMEYSTEIFRPATIERFVQYFKNIVHAVTKNVNTRIASIDILPAAEKHRLIYELNNTKSDYPKDKTLTRLFGEQANQQPGSPALIFEDEELSYGELNRKANQLARFLITRGVKRGDIVGLMIERSVEMIVGILGILKAGAAYLPFDNFLPPKRILQMLADSKPVALLTESDHITEYSPHIATIDVRDKHILLMNDADLNIPASSEDVAYIIHTSGSTGKPKGVMVRHRGVVNLIWSRKEAYRLETTERILQFSTICFDGSVEQIWLAFLNGLPLVLVRKEVILDNVLFNRYVNKHRVTHLDTTPSFLESVELDDNTTLKRIATGGEECNVELAKRFCKRFALFNEYGPTETTVISIACQVTAKDTKGGKISIGKPINNTSVFILGKYQELLPEGIKGEIYIGGDGLAKGYLNDDAQTQLRFVNHPFIPGERLYRTGDLGRWMPDGNLEFLGRADNQVKIRGFRVELGEIEAQLAVFDGIKKSVALAREKDGNKFIVAYYVSAKEVEPSALKDFLSVRLPGYMVPSYFVQLDNFPLSSTGKINRKALPDPETDRTQAFAAPSNEVEEQLAGIWSNVLKIDKSMIGVDRSFFELGGHSLRTVVLANKILKEMNVEVPVREIFRRQDIRSIAQYIKQAEKRDYTTIRKAAPKDYYVLSSAQKRLYFLYEFDRLSLAYNMPQVAKLEGALDQQRLQAAFSKLVARHESLRTSFRLINGQPVQHVTPDIDFAIEHFQSDDAGVQQIIRNFIRPFNLEQAPLLRVGLIRVTPQEHILMADMHHIITDGVSDGLLVKDFMALYNGEQLPELPLQYKDYAEWQQSKEQQSLIEQQKDFWLEEFAEEITTLELPTDFERPLVRKPEGNAVQFHLTVSETKRLKAIAESEGATMFMVLLAVYNILLARLSNQEDVVIGTPTAGRQHADLETIIGMFVNTLPIRNYPKGGLSFRIFLSAVRSKTLACFDNQAYQYEDLIDQLNVPRDTGRNPLFDVMFAYENFDDAQLEIPGLTLSAYGTGTGASQFDLTLMAKESEGRLQFQLGYATSLFKEETIQRFVAYFKKIVSAVIKDVNKRISDIEILDEEEKHALLHNLNNSRVGYPAGKTLVDLFEEQVATHADNIAVELGDVQLSYAQLNEQSNRLAAVLRQEGVERDSIVGLLAGRSIETVIGMLAILKAGGAYLPIDIDYPRERIKYMLSDSGAKISLTTLAEDDVAGYPCRFIHFDDAGITAQDGSDPVRINQPSDACYIIYTSGTTGNPKGVIVEHGNVVRLLFNDQFQFEFGAEDVWTMFHSHCFDFSVWEMYGALLYGGKLVIIPKMAARDPMQYLRILKDRKVTVLNQTPSAFYNLIEADKEDEQGVLQLRYVIFGGEALKPLKLRSWFSKYPATKLVNMFGITETTVHVTYKEIGAYEIEHNISNIGKPIPTLSAYIFDKYLNPVPQGVRGELYVGGAGVSRGYLKREALTKERFIANPYDHAERLYRTGDLARLMDNGELEYLGRIDHQVKIRGFRIELGEIESQLLKHLQVEDVVVIARTGKDGNASLIAYLVTKGEISIAGIRAHLSSVLPDYMVPAHIVLLDKIPQTSNGKVNKQLLPDPQLLPETGNALPRTALEEELCKIWAEVLQTEKPDIHSNFFTIGGDSMIAIRLVNAITKNTGVRLSIAELFINPTISTLAACIEQRRNVPQETDAAAAILALLEEQKQQFLHSTSLDKDEIEDVYPASDIQSGMIFHAMKEAGIYHDQMVHIVQYEDMDTARLDHALQLMAAKHAILRTAFVQSGSQLMQVVYKNTRPYTQHIDLRERSRAEQLDLIQQFLADDRQQAFNIGEPGLWRFITFALGANTYCVCFICHHAIIDGWSDASFNTELNNIFLELQRDPQFVPSPLTSSYKDFVISQLLAANDPQTAAYWQQELAGYKRFSFDVDPATGFYEHSGKLPADLHAKLVATAKALNLPVKNICFAAFAAALNMFSYEDDITIGMVVNNRPETEDGDKILGCFLNTVPVHVNISPSTNWTSFLTGVHDKLSRLKQYDRLPLSRIVTLIGEPASTLNPVTDVMFNYVDFHVYKGFEKQADLSGVSNDLSLPVTGQVRDNYLFSFTVDETGGNFIYSLAYDAAFANADCADSFMQYFRRIIQLVTTDPSASISKQSILPEHAFNQLIHGFNDTAQDYPKEKTIITLFEEQVQRTPGSIALVHGQTELTYAELNKRANQIARFIRNKGVTDQSVVALLINRSAEMIIAMIGILKAGAIYLPLDTANTTARNLELLKDSKAVLLITESAYETLYSEHVNTIDVRDASIQREDQHNMQVLVTPASVAYIIYTSGSTGKPKGVVTRHRSVINCIWSRNHVFGIDSSEAVLQFSTICFDASVEQIWLALFHGARLVLINKEVIMDEEAFNAYIRVHGVTHIDTTPSFLENIQLHQPNSIRRIVLGGEECKPSLAARLCKHYTVYNEYGPTETTIVAVACQATTAHLSRKRLPIGRPIHNTRVYVLDKNREPLPAGMKGELYIGGDGLAKGYLHDEMLTKEKFVDDPFVPGSQIYRTGDQARWLPDGILEFCGRIDDQVKIRGFRIELGEIEAQLAAHQHIRETAVLLKEKDGNKFLVAYYVAGNAIETSVLKEFLQARLPDYMVPAQYVHLASMPLTLNGKLDRKALPEPSFDLHEYVAPAGAAEQKLAAIWAELLNVPKEKIGTTASFLELGGHSLKIAVLVNRIAKEFNVQVPLREVFRLQNIRNLALFIRQANAAEYASIPKARPAAHYKLSSAQKRLYFLYEFDKTSLSYNLPQVMLLHGKPAGHLKEVFNKLIQRHEILRTSFTMINEEPVQVVHEEFQFELETFHADRQQAASIIKSFIRPFDLSRAPLLRAGLIVSGNDEALLMVDMHHIVTDGVSHNILVNDFMELYNGNTLPSLKLQYKDYAEWQQSATQQAEIARQKAFWLNEFAEEVTVLELPADFPRPAVKNNAGGFAEFELDHEHAEGLRRLASDASATTYMILLAVYKVLLSKLGNQEDIVVGTPAAGRQHADLDNMIGMFVNTLPMRTQPRAADTFRQYLTSVRDKALACFDNQAYQYEDLVDELKVTRDTSRNPLFDVMFTYQNNPPEERTMQGLQVRPYDSGHAVSKFDLTLDVQEAGNKLMLSFEYSTELFRHETIQRFIACFRKIVAAVVKDAHTRLSDIDILSDDERTILLKQFNDTAADYPSNKTVIDLFEEQVQRTPHRIAVICGEHQLTYKELSEQASRVAMYLNEVKDVKQGDLVGLILEREQQLIPSIFGVLMAGAAYVPIDPAHPAERINAVIEDSGLRCIITRSSHANICNKIAAGIINLDADLEAINIQQPTAIPKPKTTDLAYVIYTSGSTGKPKGVMIAHRSLTNIITCLHRMYPLEQHDRYLLKTTYSFDVSVAEIFGWFPGGGSLSLLPSGKAGDANKIIDLIERDRITHINFVPSMFGVFMDALENTSAARINSLRYIFLAGEALPADMVRRFRLLNTSIRLENIYGPTEATIYSCGYSVGDIGNRQSIPIGKPLQNIRLYITDSSFHLQPTGVPGELCIAGDALALGYLNNEALTQQKFIWHPVLNERLYRSGDLAKWLPDGNIEYMGRIDEQVKIRGFRIELGDIASQLKTHHEVTEAVAIAREHEGDKYLVAYYVAAHPIEVQSLRQYLSGRLPEYMIPAYFVHLQQIPLTPSGKINRRALPAPEASLQDQYVAPSGETETTLAGIWADILRTDIAKVGVNSNFFELGGHSLRATRLIFRIQKQFGCEVPLVDVFRYPTIRELSQRIEINKQAGEKRNELLMLLQHDPGAPHNLFFIHEGSGDVQGYVTFAGLVNQHNCWAIRSITLKQYTPYATSVQELAAHYIEVMKSVQPSGPYRLAGWSFGGTISYEIAKQLEATGEPVDLVVMIDSRFPFPEWKEGRAPQLEFTLAFEKELIFDLLESKPAVLNNATTLKSLWDQAFPFLETSSRGLDNIKSMIPEGVKEILPHFSELGMEDLVTYVNTIRTLEKAMAEYIPEGKLQARLVYLKASDTKLDTELLSQYFKREVTVIDAVGDHFSMLMHPHVTDTAQKFNYVLNQF